MDKLIQFCRDHKWTVISVVCGLVLAILLMTIGFWRTILLFALVGIALLVGVLLDRHGPDGVKEFFNNLFKGKKSA